MLSGIENINHDGSLECKVTDSIPVVANSHSIDDNGHGSNSGFKPLNEAFYFSDDDESLPDLPKTYEISQRQYQKQYAPIVGEMRPFSSSYEENEEFPNTTSLPTFTIPTQSAIPSRVGRPKEKLATLLKQSEVLLRESRKPKPELLPPPSRGGKLTAFLTSLHEETERQKKKSKLDKSHNSVLMKKLSGLVPAELLARKPKLSADNVPGDQLEITLADSPGRANSALTSLASRRSRQIVRQSIAPKNRKTSIARLNEQLNARILCEQQQSRAEREAEWHRRVKEKRRVAEMRKREEEEEEAAKGRDEFGTVDIHGTEEEMDVPVESGKKLFEIIGSDKNATLSVNDEKGELQDDDDDDDDDDEDELNDLADPIKEMEVEDAALSQMLSGRFNEDLVDEENLMDNPIEDNSTQEVVSEGDLDDRGKTRFALRKLFDEEAEEGDSDSDEEDLDAEFYEDGLEGKRPRKRRPNEDEEVDEEAIARELQESAFLVDDDDDDGLDHGNEDGKNVAQIHHKLQREQEDREMEMFINRFVPEEILRKEGAFGKLKNKYQHQDDDDDDDNDIRNYGQKVSVTDETTCKFGVLNNKVNVEPARSHPEFLKLLEQDRLTDEEEEEEVMHSDHSDDDGDELDEWENSDKEREQEEIEVVESVVAFETQTLETHLDGMFGDSIIHLHRQERKYHHAMSYSLSDSIREAGHLHQRLFASAEESAANPTSSRPGVTFDTVSSRPQIAKKKFTHGKK